MENTAFNKGDIVKVILPLNTDGYDYIVPEGGAYFPGDFVWVPLRSGREAGVIWRKNTDPIDYPISKIREIISNVGLFGGAGETEAENEPEKRSVGTKDGDNGRMPDGEKEATSAAVCWRLSPRQMAFLERVADYNIAPLGNVLKMCMGFDGLFKEGRKLKKKPAIEPKYAGVELSPEQSAAAEKLWALVAGTAGEAVEDMPADPKTDDESAVSKSATSKLCMPAGPKTDGGSEAKLEKSGRVGGFSATLLNGVTGSGKTEVYFKIIAKMLETAGSEADNSYTQASKSSACASAETPSIPAAEMRMNVIAADGEGSKAGQTDGLQQEPGADMSGEGVRASPAQAKSGLESLIEGTGSYGQAIPAQAETNTLPQILIMLPEIALTGQFLSKFENRFGTQPILWHSSLGPAQRRASWKAAANGTARVVVGTRSALFLPFENLRLIVLDEEHDGSYKQEDGVIYHGRDMAVLKASIEKIPIILASATPSIETLNNARRGKYSEVRLNSRYGEASMPDVELIDMRGAKPPKEDWGQAWLSVEMVKKIEAALLNESQVMLYINRRGYAPLVLCSECGHRLECPNCSVYLTAHNRDETRLFCHHCGFSTRLKPECPECRKEGAWTLVGPGIERIEEEARRRWPAAKTATISSDILTSQTRLNEIIRQIEEREIDIIIGTQILVKGHHFPNLTLVGVVDGDMGFSGSDLRANENTFQLLTQVSGRSGRGDKKGEVAIQTYNPDNPVMRAIKTGDRESFVRQELAERESVGMPPFSKLAAILVSAKDKPKLENFALALARAAPQGLDGVSCYGPIDAPLSVIKRSHRKRFLLVVKKGFRVQDIVKRWLAKVAIPPSIRLKIDIDPYNFT